MTNSLASLFGEINVSGMIGCRVKELTKQRVLIVTIPRNHVFPYLSPNPGTMSHFRLYLPGRWPS